MKEELFVTARSNALIDPSLHIWTWEVAMYLFLGGVTAGIMVTAVAATVMMAAAAMVLAAGTVVVAIVAVALATTSRGGRTDNAGHNGRRGAR